MGGFQGATNTKRKGASRNSYRPRGVAHKKEEKRVKAIVKEMSVSRKLKGSKILHKTYTGLTSATGTMTTDLCAVAQGDNDNQRNGNKITVTRFDWMGEIYLPGTSTIADMNDTVRIILFVEKQNNGVATAYASLLENTDPYSFFNEDNYPLRNPKRFRVLYDKTYSISTAPGGWNGTALTSGTQRIPFRITKNLKLPVQYASTTGAVTEIAQNNLCLCVISSQGAAGINSYMRTFFVDGDTGL